MLGLDQVIAGTFDLMDTGLSAHLNNKAMAKQYEYNSKLQEDAQAFQKEMRDTQYQSTVKDMEAAGINPAVALSGGASQSQSAGGSSSSVSQGAIKASNVAGTMMQAKMQSEQIKNQTALTDADVELKRAQATKELKDAGFTDKQVEYYMKHGVFPGATTTTSVSGPLGISGSTTRPVGLKDDKNNKDNEPNKPNKKYKYKSWTPEGVRERLGFTY